MSDDNQPPKPPAPMKKTSAVPLKKETVRVTLKSEPTKPAAPTASAPAAPSAPKPPAPAPTIPLKTAPVATAPGAPRPVGGAPAPAPTIPLKTAPAAASKPLATAAVGGGNQPLPQATVQLQSTQPLGTPTASTSPQIGTIATTDVDDDDDNDTIPTVMSILAFVLALGVLVIGLMTWMTENEIGALFG